MIATRYIILFFMMAVVSELTSCNSGRKKLNERISLWRNDKIPYGTFYAYENLERIFPNAGIEISKKSPDKYKGLNLGEPAQNYDQGDERSAYIIISPQVQPDAGEIAALFNYIGEGNHVFISSFSISTDLLDSLRLQTARYSGYHNRADSLTINITHPVTYESLSFSYPGKAMDNYFVSLDSSITSIIGRDRQGEVNFVKINYESGGSISVHLAPLSFTNFFLLHAENKEYYDNAFSYLPHDVQLVKWDEYFRNRIGNKKNTFSKLSAFLDNEILRWAFWLIMLLFTIIYLFESKRKQAIVPVMAPVKNASLDFVKTIGRLYYQRKDNKNLALKMSAHFLEGIRNRYNIPTSVLNDEFENKLAYKSGYDRTAIHDIVYSIRTIPDQYSISDEELLSFNHKIQEFTKHH